MIRDKIVYLTVIIGLITGCSKAVFYNPEILTGGLNSLVADEYPSYSADGRYLAFASDRNGVRNIYLFDLVERQLVPLPNLNRNDSTQEQPSLSQDGRYLAYISTERGKTDVLVYDRQTQKSELLTANIRGSVRHPTITGDGKKIAFQTSQLGQWNIVIIERN
jgi:Tol biopolymer transport system component